MEGGPEKWARRLLVRRRERVFDGDWKADGYDGGARHLRFANGDVDSNSYHQNEIVGEGILALTRLSRNLRVDCCCAKEKRKVALTSNESLVRAKRQSE